MQAESAPAPSSRLSNSIALLVTSMLLVLPLVLPHVLPGLKPGTSGPALCMSKQLLRISCPGCGLTRSVCATMRLDLAASMRMHLFGPAVMAIFAWIWVAAAAGLVKGRNYLPDPGSKRTSLAAAGFMSALVAYWLIRIVTGTLPP